MAKKVIRLTESKLNQIIKEATAKVMNEMDAATYSRIHNASHRAMQDIQNGNYERSVNDKKKIGRSLNFPWQAPEVLTKDGAYTIQEERDVRNAMQLCSESFDL